MLNCVYNTEQKKKKGEHMTQTKEMGVNLLSCLISLIADCC